VFAVRREPVKTDVFVVIVAALLGTFPSAAGGSSSPVETDAISLDEGTFTSYVEKRLQLYSPAPINVVGTFELSVGKGDAEMDLPSIRSLHESCVRDQRDCQHFVDSFIQDMALYIHQFHLDVDDVPPATEPSAAVSSADAQLGHSPAPLSTTLRVCNRTQQRLAIAVSFVPKGEQSWLNRGWQYIPGNKCDAVLTTASNTFYARAQQGFDIGLGTAGDIKLCVQYPGGYSYLTKKLETSCANGPLAGFRTFHATGNPVIVWNVDP